MKTIAFVQRPIQIKTKNCSSSFSCCMSLFETHINTFVLLHQNNIWSFFLTEQKNWYTYVYTFMFMYDTKNIFSFRKKSSSRCLLNKFYVEFSVEFWRFSKIDVLFGKWRRKPTVTITFFFYFILQATYIVCMCLMDNLRLSYCKSVLITK